MLGGFSESGRSKSLFTCQLAVLFQSCQPQSLVARLKTLSLASGPEAWHQLADTPVTLSTCASLQGRLLAFGGKNSDYKDTTAIYMYNTTNSWMFISHMATPQCRCLVAVLPEAEVIVVVGGRSTELASITYR